MSDDKVTYAAKALFKHALKELSLNEGEAKDASLTWQDYIPQVEAVLRAVEQWEQQQAGAPSRSDRISVVHTSSVKLPRPGNGGYVGVRVEACLCWAPSTDHDGCTDIWTGGHKFTVALPFDKVDAILEQARGGEA